MSLTNLTQNAISETIGPQIENNNKEIVELLNSLNGPEIGTQDLLRIQTRLQQLQTVTGLHSQLIKSLGDLFKDILQKTN